MPLPPDVRNIRGEHNAQWLADLPGRLVLTHRIDAGVVASVLHVTRDDAAALADGRPVPLGTSPRLSLVVNIIVRLEIRLAGDSCGIRDALATPLDHLGERVPPT